MFKICFTRASVVVEANHISAEPFSHKLDWKFDDSIDIVNRIGYVKSYKQFWIGLSEYRTWTKFHSRGYIFFFF